ncbi:hypothetical protein CLOP_g5642, partial [Closterium sp. NIES-67]
LGSAVLEAREAVKAPGGGLSPAPSPQVCVAPIGACLHDVSRAEVILSRLRSKILTEGKRGASLNQVVQAVAYCAASAAKVRLFL